MFPPVRLSSLLFLVLAMVSAVRVQAQWQDVTEVYLLEATTQASWLGCGMSLADFNLDGLDDLTFANSDGSVVAYAQLPEGGFDLVHSFQGEAQAQGLAWFDADGDEDLDLMITRRFARMELYMRSGDVLVEEGPDRGLPINSDWEGRGLSVGDYDLDGDLDVYVCLYHDGTGSTHENLLFNNDGNGFFTDVTELAGVGNQVQHSFQAIWFDYNQDGYEDLWVINDRDIFPNALYENQGNGTFVDVAQDVGAAQAIFGMTATVGDCDNDGVMELFCTNIENEPNLMLDRIGPVYQEVGPQMGVDGSRYSWGGCFVDADGDMWSDLMVATYRFPNALPYDNYFYENAHPEYGFVDVTEASWPNEQTQLYCVGACDIDQDLAPDVIGFGNMPFVQVLRNTTADDGGGPGRLAVRLCGTETNRWAIGAVVEVHAGGVVQTQFVSNGSDFMTQQTCTRYFGLADALVVDSVVVEWRGGAREVWYDVEPNSTVSFIEGSTDAQISVQGTPCGDEVATATAPFDAPVIRWNGEVVDSPTFELVEAGPHVVECEWMGGLFTWTDSIEWVLPEPHGLTVEWTEPECHGEPGILGWVADDGLIVDHAGLTWDAVVTNLGSEAGEVIFLTTSPETGCVESHEFILPEPPELGIYLEYSPALCHDDVAQVLASGYGGTPGYLVNWSGVDPSDLPPGEVEFTLTDGNGCTLDSSLLVVIPAPLTIEVVVFHEDAGEDGSLSLLIEGGTPPYNVLWNDGTQGDTVLTNLGQGVYSWVVEDANGCLLLGLQDIINVGSSLGPHSPQRWSLDMTGTGWALSGEPADGDRVEVLSLSGQLVWSEPMSTGQVIGSENLSLPPHGVVRVLDAEGRLVFGSAY